MTRDEPLRPNWRLTREEQAAFVIVAVASFALVLALPNLDAFPYDAHGYWYRLRDAGLADSIRGYVPILAFGGLRAAAVALNLSAPVVVAFVNALLMGWLAAILLPRLAGAIWPQRPFGLGRRVGLGALLLVFWNGHLAYPLTDIPAFAFATGAVLLATRSDRWIGLLGAGALAGIALNLRPAYLALPVAVVLLAAARGRCSLPSISVSPLRRVGLVVGGVVALALPQLMLNGSRWDTWSPIPGAPSHLTAFQLTAGLRLQLYGVYVGPRSADMAGPVMNYVDAAGASLVPQSMRLAGGVRGYGDYLRIAEANPRGVIANLARHIVNGFDQRVSTPYPTHVDTGQRTPFRLGGFVVIGLALTRLLWPAARRTLGRACWAPFLAVATAAITAAPTAMEQRYLLPWFALALLVAVAPGWRELPRVAASRRFGLQLALVVCCWAFVGWQVARVVQATSASLQFGADAITSQPW